MTTQLPITIVGGGLAGLTLAIGLRRRGVPVTVYEAGRYPRHRVCGEFICGRGQRVLERLGLSEALTDAGAIPAKSARFFFGPLTSPVRRLDPPAISISRFVLDAALAAEFRRLGGDLREGTRWNGTATDSGVVLASGRQRQINENGWRWFGLKVHARDVRLSSDLEMHTCRNGYVGISRLAGGEVNICGLFRGRAEHGAAPGWEGLLRGGPGTSLHHRLAEAEFERASFCSVGGLGLRVQRAAGRAECCIGDALTMIPPVTGNGMSMAFEAAELAAEPLAGYSRGDRDWPQAREEIARDCDAAFSRRLKWARCVQWLMFSAIWRGPWSRPALRRPWLWELLFARTR